MTVLLSGLAGLLAGALSMGAGEYVSVRSQRELLEASQPGRCQRALPDLDVDANELALVYRARGMDAAAARRRADTVLGSLERYAAAQAVSASLLRSSTPLPSESPAVPGRRRPTSTRRSAPDGGPRSPASASSRPGP